MSYLNKYIRIFYKFKEKVYNNFVRGNTRKKFIQDERFKCYDNRALPAHRHDFVQAAAVPAESRWHSDRW